MRYQIPKQIQFILDLFHLEGCEAFLVGGCVRDLLLGRKVHDYDITTNCLPEEMLKLAKKHKLKAIPTGIAFGTITFIIDHMRIEVTTYRQESTYENYRKPSHVDFSKKLEDDIIRRDFTINALCLDGDNIIDFVDGQHDLKLKLVRCIRNPEDRFQEDALRILRALRFSFSLSFEIEKNTYQALKDYAYLLQFIAKERIQDELIKMLNTQAKDFLLVLKDSQVLPYIIPEYEQTYDVKQNTPYHQFDVFHHLNECMNVSVGATLTTRLALLLHDLAKKEYRTTDDEGVDHFKGHAQAGAVLAHKILNRLRFSKKTIQSVETLIYYHDYRVQPDLQQVRLFLYELKGDFALARQILEVQIFDNLAKSKKMIKDKNDQIDQVLQIINKLQMKNEAYRIDQLNISGEDLIEIGIHGKEIGKVLQQVLQFVLNNQDKNKKAILMKVAGGIKDEIING